MALWIDLGERSCEWRCRVGCHTLPRSSRERSACLEVSLLRCMRPAVTLGCVGTNGWLLNAGPCTATEQSGTDRQSGEGTGWTQAVARQGCWDANRIRHERINAWPPPSYQGGGNDNNQG